MAEPALGAPAPRSGGPSAAVSQALAASVPPLTRQHVQQAADPSINRWTVFHSSVFRALDASVSLAQWQAGLADALRGPDGRWGGQRGTHVAWIMEGTATPEEAEAAFAATVGAINNRLGALGQINRDDVLVLPEADPDQTLRLIESALPGSRVTAVYGPEAFADRFYRDSGETLVPIALPRGAGDAAGLGAGAGVAAGLAASGRGGSPDPEIPLQRRDDAMYVPPMERVSDPAVEEALRSFQVAVDAAGREV